jgi:hypothetical protein
LRGELLHLDRAGGEVEQQSISLGRTGLVEEGAVDLEQEPAGEFEVEPGQGFGCLVEPPAVGGPSFVRPPGGEPDLEIGPLPHGGWKLGQQELGSGIGVQLQDPAMVTEPPEFDHLGLEPPGLIQCGSPSCIQFGRFGFTCRQFGGIVETKLLEGASERVVIHADEARSDRRLLAHRRSRQFEIDHQVDCEPLQFCLECPGLQAFGQPEDGFGVEQPVPGHRCGTGPGLEIVDADFMPGQQL